MRGLSKRAIARQELEELARNNQKISMNEFGFHAGTLDLSSEDIDKLKQIKPKKIQVRLSDLHTPQTSVLAAEVLKLSKRKEPYKTKSHLSLFRPDAKIPQVISNKGKLFIADGNHRLAASVLAGHIAAEVYLYEL